MLDGMNSEENRARLRELIGHVHRYLHDHNRAQTMLCDLMDVFGERLSTDRLETRIVPPPPGCAAPVSAKTETVLNVVRAFFAAIEQYRVISGSAGAFEDLFQSTGKLQACIVVEISSASEHRFVSLSHAVVMYEFYRRGAELRWSEIPRGLVRFIPDEMFSRGGKNKEEAMANLRVETIEMDRGISYASVHADLSAAMQGIQWSPLKL